MNLKSSQKLINPTESVDMGKLCTSFMKLFRNWAEVNTKYNKDQLGDPWDQYSYSSLFKYYYLLNYQKW